MGVPTIPTQGRWICRQLGMLAATLDHWPAVTRWREAFVWPAAARTHHQHAAKAYQEAVRRQERADPGSHGLGPAYAASLADWCPIRDEGRASRARDAGTRGRWR